MSKDSIGSIAFDGRGGSIAALIIGLAAGMYTATNTAGPADGNHNPLWPANFEMDPKVEAGTPKSFASVMNPSLFGTPAVSGRGPTVAFPRKVTER